MFRHDGLRFLILGLLVLAALYQVFTAGYFGLEILTEILILAMLALALDIVAGFGGMVSLCHGALMGAGAYAFAVLAANLGLPPSLAMTCAVLLTGAMAWVVGAICARSHGIYFIMATLALGQMAYSFVFESRALGGDDGLGGIPRVALEQFGGEPTDSRDFALFCLAALVVAYIASACILKSGLGRSLTGIMHNEQRMSAIGITAWRVKAHAFGLSGLIAGLAGTLAAQHTQYISPGLLNWTVSGEVLVVVILGGLGTLVGPLLGAAVFVTLKHEISSFTNHWHLVVGFILIAVVMSRANGIFGMLEALRRKFTRSQSPDQNGTSPKEETLSDA